jgi:hypothetical protein
MGGPLPKCEIRVVFDLADKILKPRFVNGQELPNWKDGPDMVEYVRQKEHEGCCMKISMGPQTYIFDCPCDNQ